MRRVMLALVAVALVVAVFVLWPRSADDTPDAGSAMTSTTSTTTPTNTPTPTDSVPPPSSDDAHVVETVEEAEAILRELWFGWFEGIYNQDEDRIREVVASQSMYDAATAAFGAPFLAEPNREEILLTTEILFASTSCLVTYGHLDVSEFRGPGASTQSVQVLRKVEDTWRFMTSWSSPSDLWEADCESQLLPLR